MKKSEVFYAINYYVFSNDKNCHSALNLKFFSIYIITLFNDFK